MKEKKQSVVKCPYCQTPLLGTDWFQLTCECGYHSPKQESKMEVYKIIESTCVVREVKSLEVETKKDSVILNKDEEWEYYPGGFDYLEDGDVYYLELPDVSEFLSKAGKQIEEIKDEIRATEKSLAKAKEKLAAALMN